MKYHDILFPYGRPKERVSEELLKDLRIDSVLLMLSQGPNQLKYDTCYLPLTDRESVLYRHAIFQDIMRFDLYPVLMKFQEMMDTINLLEDQLNRLDLPVLRYRYQLNRMIELKKTLLDMLDFLKDLPLKSEGLARFREDLSEYVSSEAFILLDKETSELKAALAEITFSVYVHDNHIAVRKIDGEELIKTGSTEFEKEVSVFFDQFIHGRAPFQRSATDSWFLNPVEEKILGALMTLFPEHFSRLEKMAGKKSRFVPDALISYHQDLGFYTVWMEYILPKQAAKLNFCFPMITGREDGFMAANCFDLVLADQMLGAGQQVVRNNLVLKPGERILVLTGPNQGGKTTYARMLGQLFYLGSLGIPVPGTVVKIFLPDRIFTHFEKQESQQTLNGKLKDDLIRIHDILQQATENSLILINEMFSSTTLRDAAWLGKNILNEIHDRGALCLYVTFINELASFIPGTVSLVSEIGEDLNRRTYQIVRAAADGKAYAKSMIHQYGLTYESISERIGDRE